MSNRRSGMDLTPPTSPRIERGRLAERRGRWAEVLCRLMLRLSGYRILAVRVRTKVGEIDILARRGDLLVVVEVKARADIQDAAGAVSAQQWSRLARAAAAFLARRPELSGLAVRFDVMLVRPWAWPYHLSDVWRP